MAYLLDTDVLSKTRRKQRDANLEAWLRGLTPNEVFLSAMTVGEIEKGIEKQRAINPEFADDLAQWLDRLLAYYSDRILPVTTEIARSWGRLCQVLGNSNVDLLIAATALEHGLTVATHNTSHFVPTGAAVIDPANS